ncbi:MAG: hypothetical protein AUJ12_10260 [Alphaproteobacteria bacterium CG1_02_46_17]|nr:MAG: hypothetical protein AUJ12_10260 [Alphaproteobacteria bacterium CG1_02_46_17]
MKIIPVILCGGSGTRLWPESQETLPKQFLNLINDQSLLQNTISRATRVAHVTTRDVVCVCLDDLADLVLQNIRQLDPDAGLHILREPSARNTAAAVALASLYCSREFGEECLIWVLPSDHYIGKEYVLEDALQAAAQSALQGKLVTFGITPTRPETGYGYIKCNQPVAGEALPVEQFVEKPDVATAISFLNDGQYLWNSGMFLFQTSTVLNAFTNLAGEIFDQVKQAVGAGENKVPDAALYNQVPKSPFDKSIMEKSAEVTVVPCDMAWSDVGTWGSIWDISQKTADQNVVQGHAVLEDSHGCLVRANSGRLVACAGLEDIVVIDTPDAVLVTRRATSDPLKKLVERMKTSK